MAGKIWLFGKYNYKFTLVDNDNFEELNKYRWMLNGTGYAYRKHNNKKELMHRVILKITDSQIAIDHINRNKLDNRKENLRIASKSQNGANTEKTKKPTSSIFKGVSKKNNIFQATIRFNNKNYFIGYFHNEMEAAQNYDYYALKYFGEFACLNFPHYQYDNFVPQSKHKYSSHFYGISIIKSTQRWLATIIFNSIHYKIGDYQDEIIAAQHYDYINWLFYQDKSKLNFPEIDYNHFVIHNLRPNICNFIVQNLHLIHHNQAVQMYKQWKEF